MPACRSRAPGASCAAVAVLALSQYVSFHARGDAAFAWHGLTGDVAEMSRDVLGLLLSFDPPRDDAAQHAPAGLGQEQAQEFTAILRSRRFLVQTSGKHRPDEMSPLLAGFPRVPRGAVFERNGDAVTLYTRAGTALPLEPVTAQLFLRCDGERSLGQVLGDAGPQALDALLRLARADVAALKILAKPVSQGGVQLNAAAESTMPYPEITDVRLYAVGGPAPQSKIEDEPTLASLFAAPHPSLGGRTYSQAMADELRRRGAFRGSGPFQVLSLGLAMELPEAQVETNIAKVQQSESYHAVVVNEIGAQLGFSDGKNSGLIRLVTDAASALAPGGVLIVGDYGDPKAEASPGSVRFADLLERATQSGLSARVVPLAEVLNLDMNAQALSTTRASLPALQAMFAAHGLALTRRAWLRTEIEKLAEGKLELANVHGLQWAPLSERALGLAPRQFWALVAAKPERTLH